MVMKRLSVRRAISDPTSRSPATDGADTRTRDPSPIAAPLVWALRAGPEPSRRKRRNTDGFVEFLRDRVNAAPAF